MRDKFKVIEDEWIPLRDGVSLSARVWMPEVSEIYPLPVILEALPYRKRDGTYARDNTTHNHFAANGYVCIRVDLRGTGDSEGVFEDEYSNQELDDIEDVIDWAAARAWCSGSVGIMGISWGGINALQTASRRPSALKAVIAAAAVLDRFDDDIHYKGGCELAENVGWAARAMSIISLPPDPEIAGEGWRDLWLNRLEKTSFLPGLWSRHRSRDTYWKRGSVLDDARRIDIPVLAIAGLRDGYRNLPINLLNASGNGTPVKALLGPWDHNYPHIASYGPWLDFPQEAVRWWDRWLKGIENGADAGPALRAYIMNGTSRERHGPDVPGRWVSLQNWPDSSVSDRVFHFNGQELGAEEGQFVRRVNPQPLCGIKSGEFFSTQLCDLDHPAEQSPDDALSLLFETRPVRDAISFLGTPKVTLSVASDTTSGQVVARLCDVAPDGDSRLISIGMLNLLFRDGFERAADLKPGESYRVHVGLDHIGYELPAGHRLRLALSSSYWPYSWPDAEPCTLTVTGGQLSMPVFAGRETPLANELPARIERSMFVRSLNAPVKTKSLQQQDGRHVLEILSNDGGIAIEEFGLQRFSSVREKWSIDPGDISSPQVDIEWNGLVSREGFAAGTQLQTSMRADARFIYLAGKLEALEEGTCIFSREFFERVPRKPEVQQD
ncbi:CocE/NonD family hydrolase [Roseibium sp. RKSG952]|uniref:CocE/NonD family hydrolase n=1 Tax=Roseibium sp. RKSG952 TaxID=2529384 RepID=UPI0018AD279D|nr:CocE/NonD family hydrolase [Roseibium sp. RKSG952]